MHDNDAVLSRAAERQARGEAFALVTVVRSEDSTSAKPGAKALVSADGVIDGWIGGGCAQPAVLKTVRQALADGQSRLIRIRPGDADAGAEGIIDFAMQCHSGGTLDIFIDPVRPQPVLLVLGGSPVVGHLLAMAGRLGFHRVLALPGARADDYPDADSVIDGFDLGNLSASFAVVATQGQGDEAALEAALNREVAWVAFVASARKAAQVRANLAERGQPPQRLDAIQAPAGVSIQASTPAEIALSVLAALVQARATLAAPVTLATAEVPRAAEVPAPAEAGDALDPICGMSVDIATALYHSDHQGQRYYFCCAGCQRRFEQEPQRYVEEASA